MKGQHKSVLTGKIRPGDFAVMAGIALAALGIWLCLFRGAPAVRFRLTTLSGTEYLAGDTEKEVLSGGYRLRIVIRGGEAHVAESDCPTQDCVHSSAISRAGQSIVCLPAGVVVEACGEEADAFDAIGG